MGTAVVVPEQVTSGITEKLVITVAVLGAGAAEAEAVTVTVLGAVDAGTVPFVAPAHPVRTMHPAATKTAAADRTSPMAPLPDRAGDPRRVIETQPAPTVPVKRRFDQPFGCSTKS
jgi:hypothetical protein